MEKMILATETTEATPEEGVLSAFKNIVNCLRRKDDKGLGFLPPDQALVILLYVQNAFNRTDWRAFTAFFLSVTEV